MKIAFRLAAGLIAVLLLVVATCYLVGLRLPVEHTTTVTGTVDATPAKVFAIITNVAAGATWRSEVRSVQVLPPDDGRAHWVEDLGHGTKMSFLALSSEAPGSDGHAQRSVQLADPGAAYGGTWAYVLSPGANPGQTILRITETGYINPPLYRFLMVHLVGMTRNLDKYMQDIQAQARK